MREVLRAVSRRVRGLVARGVLELIDDAPKMQTVQLTGLDGDLVDDVERFQAYGLTSNPKPGAECVFVSIGSSGDHPVVIAVDDRRYRLKSLEPGEVALYDDLGQVVHLKRDRIEVTSPHVVVKSSNVELGGDSLVALTDGVVVAQGIDTFTGATYGALGNASSKVKAKK